MVDEYHSRVQSKNFNWRLAAWLSALLLVVLGAKLWVIQVYGTAVPYWDQWDEAKRFFKPWLEGHLTWGAWFAPHNEHRIFFTRALDLLGFGSTASGTPSCRWSSTRSFTPVMPVDWHMACGFLPVENMKG